MEDFIKATGKVVLELRDGDGQLKEYREIDNLVVKVGKNFIASRMLANGVSGFSGSSASGYNTMSHMAVGSSSTGAQSTDLTLGTELGRVALTSATLGVNPNENVITFVASFPAGTGTGGVQEAGIFNVATNGFMLCRTVFSIINKAAADSLTINWNVTIN